MNNLVLEIIGMHVVITESVNSELVNISGMVIDETKHMLKLDTKFGEKMIPKKICKFMISKYEGDSCTVSGTKLHNRSHERLEVLV
jgi:RNase P/RNase MRP subunit p29